MKYDKEVEEKLHKTRFFYMRIAPESPIPESILEEALSVVANRASRPAEQIRLQIQHLGNCLEMLLSAIQTSLAAGNIDALTDFALWLDNQAAGFREAIGTLREAGFNDAADSLFSSKEMGAYLFAFALINKATAICQSILTDRPEEE